MAASEVSNNQIYELLLNLQKRVEKLEAQPEAASEEKATPNGDSAPDLSVLVGAIDQGTTSSRFLIFSQAGELVASHQTEFTQYYPNPGSVTSPLQLCTC